MPKIPPARTTILTWVENNSILRNDDCWAGQVWPCFSEMTLQTVDSKFGRNSTRSQRKAVAKSRDSLLCNTEHPQKPVSHLSEKDHKGTSLTAKDYAQRVASSKSGMDNKSSVFGSLREINFFDECVFHVSGRAIAHSTRIWSTESPTDTQEHEF